MFCVVDVQTAVDSVLLVDVVHVVDVHAAGARPKKKKPNSEAITLAVEKNSLGPAQKHARPKSLPTRSRKHTGKSPTLFLPLGP